MASTLLTWWFPFLFSLKPRTTSPMAMNVDSTNDIHEKARLAWISEQALLSAFLAISAHNEDVSALFPDRTGIRTEQFGIQVGELGVIGQVVQVAAE
jgi:hypothetical protein